jgi:hypothetical protein
VVLSAGQFSALQNLARKQAGEDVGWINIADARSLTALGLAERNPEGWKITATGAAALIEGGLVSQSEIIPLTEGDAPA